MTYSCQFSPFDKAIKHVAQDDQPDILNERFEVMKHELEVKKAYQQGVPTKVFLTRCLSPESNRQAETPRSPSLIAPREPMRIFPAFRKKKQEDDGGFGLDILFHS